MKTGERKLMKTRGDGEERERETPGEMLRYTNGESERVREIWGETLTVGEKKIKVFDRGEKKNLFHLCQSTIVRVTKT